MLIIAPSDSHAPSPDEILPDGDLAALNAAAAGTNLAPFEILGESVVPGLTQVPLILQGTFIQITNTGGSASFGLQYKPTVPFVASPPGGKIKLTANYISNNLNISDITQTFVNNPAAPGIGFFMPAGGTIIVGVQYVATGLSLVAAPLAATEAAGNRGSVQLNVSSGGSFLVTATVRQVFVNQQTLATVAAAAYSVPIAGGPVVTG
ncbi:MAG: hypothetical protein PGN25_10745 [Methylorubrum populi]